MLQHLEENPVAALGKKKYIIVRMILHNGQNDETKMQLSEYHKSSRSLQLQSYVQQKKGVKTTNPQHTPSEVQQVSPE